MSDRLPKPAFVGLLLIGLVAAVQLTLVQVGRLGAWDPFFGEGTMQVLTSAPARALPVPDAGLGALAYLVELWLVWTASPARPGRAAALTLLATAMGLGSIGLIGLQAIVVGAFCTLCLVSAFVSIVVALAELPALRALVNDWRGRREMPNARSQAHPARTRSIPPR